MQTEPAPLAKVLVVGAAGVGKTSLVNRLVFHDFVDVTPTIGVNFAQKVCIGCGGPLNLSIWDLSGQERFRFIMPQLCRGAVGVVLVFDQTQPASLEAAADWQAFIARYASPSHRHAIVLVGAKADLQPTVDKAILEGFCRAHNIKTFIQCSSKTGGNVKQVFDSVASAIQLSRPELGGNAGLAVHASIAELRDYACETTGRDD